MLVHSWPAPKGTPADIVDLMIIDEQAAGDAREGKKRNLDSFDAVARNRYLTAYEKYAPSAVAFWG